MPAPNQIGNEATVVPKTMTAMVQNKYGEAVDVLRPDQVPVPSPGEGQMLVRVHYSSVNALEWHLMNGKPYVFRAVFGLRPKRPTLGADFSGTVVEVGAGVEGFNLGDAVFGSAGAGSYAEFVVVSGEATVLKPEGVSFEDAAAVGVAGLTALQGIRDVGALGAGQSALIIGASGGVGTYAIQIAKSLGATVTAVCSARNAEQAAALGADRVVNYEVEDFTTLDDRFDLIFDGPGNRSIHQCKKLLKPEGRYVLMGGPKHKWLGPIRRILGAKVSFALGDKKAANFTAEVNPDDLALLGDLLASGKVRSVIADSFPLKEVGVPLDRQGQFHASGKTVVAVEGAV